MLRVCPGRGIAAPRLGSQREVVAKGECDLFVFSLQGTWLLLCPPSIRHTKGFRGARRPRRGHGGRGARFAGGQGVVRATLSLTESWLSTSP